MEAPTLDIIIAAFTTALSAGGWQAWFVFFAIPIAGIGSLAILYFYGPTIRDWLVVSNDEARPTTNPARCDYCATDTELERPFTCPKCGGPNEPKG